MTTVLLLLIASAAANEEASAQPLVNGWAETRIEECLGRGMLAVPVDAGIYVGWRLLREDPEDVAFNLYRKARNGEAVKLNETPLTETTDFIDTNLPDDSEYDYFVRPVMDTKEGPDSEKVPVRSGTAPLPYISMPLRDEGTTFRKVAIADLNGDGRYDFIIKTPDYNVDPWYKSWKPSEVTYTLEAYLSDGTFLWKKDLGWSIEAGVWYSPYIAYDLDGDGKAEIILKTGPDQDLRTTEATNHYKAGRVMEGPEYLTILDGMTGEVRATADWPSREGFERDAWNPDGYNFWSRNQIGVAYLDGKTPAVVVVRGTYTTMKVHTYHFQDNTLDPVWQWDDSEETDYDYRGQGAHFLQTADLDGDGRDEIVLGASVLDDNGRGLWSLEMGHADHVYVGNIDPTRDGLEIYYGFEWPKKRNGICMVDAATGRYLWGVDERTGHIHSSGLVSDIDRNHPGMECYSGEKSYPADRPHRRLHTAQGKLLAHEDTFDLGLRPRAVHWDASPQRELVHNGRIFNYNEGTVYLEGLPGRLVAWGDIVGDWREELIVSVPGELRIYTTTIPARDRRVTLLQDAIYRRVVAHNSMGYTQVPLTGRGQATP